MEQSSCEWLLLAVQLLHEVCKCSEWGPSVLPHLPFHSLREQVISCFVHWSKQADGVVNVLHGWEGGKTVCVWTWWCVYTPTHLPPHTHTDTHTERCAHVQTSFICCSTSQTSGPSATTLVTMFWEWDKHQQQQAASTCSHPFYNSLRLLWLKLDLDMLCCVAYIRAYI